MKEQVTVASHIKLRQQGKLKGCNLPQKEKAKIPASEDASDIPNNDHLNINPDSTVVQKSRVALLKYLQWVRRPEWQYGRAPEVQELLDSSDDETLADIIMEGWMDGFHVEPPQV